MINALIARAVIGQPVPEVGMGATILYVNDRYPATIISVDRLGRNHDGKMLIEVQFDNYVANKMNAADVDADWDFTPNPKGAINLYRQEPTGFWQRVERSAHSNTPHRLVKVKGGPGLRIGERDYYYEWSI